MSASLFVPGLVHGTGNIRALFGINALVNDLVHQRVTEQLFVRSHGFQSRQIFASLCSACGNSVDSFTVIHNAVQAAVACNALGVLICDWSLPGHVNPLSVSIPALLSGAGLAWKSSAELVSRNLICILMLAGVSARLIR